MITSDTKQFYCILLGATMPLPTARPFASTDGCVVGDHVWHQAVLLSLFPDDHVRIQAVQLHSRTGLPSLGRLLAFTGRVGSGKAKSAQEVDRRRTHPSTVCEASDQPTAFTSCPLAILAQSLGGGSCNSRWTKWILLEPMLRNHSHTDTRTHTHTQTLNTIPTVPFTHLYVCMTCICVYAGTRNVGPMLLLRPPPLTATNQASMANMGIREAWLLGTFNRYRKLPPFNRGEHRPQRAAGDDPCTQEPPMDHP